MSDSYYTYILASKRNGALYVGVAEDLAAAVLDHKCNMVDGLTSQYAIHLLVYYEVFNTQGEALLRERALKAMHRAWKLELVEGRNPCWRDLYESLGAATGALESLAS